MPAKFYKDRPGRMGVLTVPQGARIYRRSNEGKTFERVRREFDVLAMPSTVVIDGMYEKCFSFKMREEYWYVLEVDVSEDY